MKSEAESGNGQRGNFSWTELAKSTKIRGKLLCSGVGIKNSYKHQVQSADIDIIFGPMLKNWEVYDVNRGNAQAMAQSFRYWNISLGGDRQDMLWWWMVVRVKYVPTEQSFSNDSSHCLVIVKNKIKLHLQNKNSVWLSNIINKDFGCRWIWNYNDPRWEAISTSDSVLGRYYFSPRVIIISYPPQPKSIFVYYAPSSLDRIMGDPFFKMLLVYCPSFLQCRFAAI